MTPFCPASFLGLPVAPRARRAAWCINTSRMLSSLYFCVRYEQMSRHYLKAGRLHKSRWSIGVILSVGLKNILQNEAKETRKSAAK